MRGWSSEIFFCQILLLTKIQLVDVFLDVIQLGLPEFLDSRHKSLILDPGRWTLDADAGLWTLDSGLWTLNSGRWALDARFWTLGTELWTLSSGR